MGVTRQRPKSPTRQTAARGFTMIELMVVMSLIVILATIGLAQYRHSVVYTKEAVLKDDLFKLRDAIDQYYADKNQYPATLDALVTDGYIRGLPKDPFTNSEQLVADGARRARSDQSHHRSPASTT